MPRKDSPDFDYSHPKTRDPFIFKPADDFFGEINHDPAASGTRQPQSISYSPDHQLVNGEPNPACNYGRIFQFDDGKFLLIQFMRPRVWRIRFNPQFRSAHDFSDINTRTIVQHTLTKLVQVLNKAEGINWRVDFTTLDARYFLLQSILIKEDGTEEPSVQLWIQRDPFRITAIRSIAPSAVLSSQSLPALQHPTLISPASIPAVAGRSNAIIWQTKERGLLYQDNATILQTDKSPTAKYLGFGEQGGKSLYKDKTFMNYFNFDNMRYYNIYDQGPENDSEPLYHSEPYWIEVNAHPGHNSQLATFIDNYSQVVVDLGKTHERNISVATRFNSFQGIYMAGDTIGHVITLYTSIIGRPWLRPRYVLGNHQGCYGYETQTLVEFFAEEYQKWEIPLDGMHIDVDMQRNYKTFTIDTREHRFPRPEAMFSKLRSLGIRCGANITPIISCMEEPGFTYETYESAWAGSRATGRPVHDNYFVRDRRDDDPCVSPGHDERYLQYGKGERYYKNPNSDRPAYGDDYDFTANRNSGLPFRGGVDYGGGRGSPGFYPNLNSEEVRLWWGKQYSHLFKTGLEFVWQDMTSPCMAQEYGDMKSWPFRLLLDSDGWPGDPLAQERKKAIEIWSLYSFNLHKATFNGLHQLEGRQDKRNFIIGRGSFAGAQRYAGLWTGDNSSDWKFFSISVAQVLALGLSGVAVSGADVGGFEPEHDGDRFADPELLIRWYGAYSLLPWFRNHYVRKDKKWFQEPFEYEKYRLRHPERIRDCGQDQEDQEDQEEMFMSVLPVCRYAVRLRYSLLQLLYDAMFENVISGLPIARAMVVTDPLDSSLFTTNEWYTAHQYLVRNDLLVAPVLYAQAEKRTRRIYLPHPDAWYPLNLRPDTPPDQPGVALQPKARGGSFVEYDSRISHEESQIPYVTPMYVREGAILPQIEVRQSTPDRTRPETANEPPNPITIHVYPGKDNSYCMYLDDGVSRQSAPMNDWLASKETTHLTDDNGTTILQNAHGDPKAGNTFREVLISQRTVRTIDDGTASTATATTIIDNWHDVRRITITTPFSGYADDLVTRDVGDEYRIAIWHAPDVDLTTLKVDAECCSATHAPWTNSEARVTLARVPIAKGNRAVVTVTHAV